LGDFISGKYLKVVFEEAKIHIGASLSWIALKNFTSCPAFAGMALL